jgi:hypothetical protein
MFCSGCGQTLVTGQAVCPQCGRPVAPPIPPVPNLEFQLNNYAGRIKALSIVWFVYGGLSLVLGVLGLAFANAFFHGNFGPWQHGPWDHGPWGPESFWPAIMRFGWAIVVVRSALAFAAGWGLMERAEWGRIVAIVASFLLLLKIPVGTALGIWTLVTLLGYRNTSLYEQLQ